MNRARITILAVLFALQTRATEPTVMSGGIYSLQFGIANTGGPLTGGAFIVQDTGAATMLLVGSPQAPTIQIQYQGSNIVITWSAAIDAFQLEQTVTLGAAWTPLAATQQSAGAEIKVTVPIAAQNQFLRLKKNQ